MIGGNLGRMHTHRDTFTPILADAALSDSEELDRVVDARCLLHIFLRDARNALDGNIVDADAGMEGERRKNRALGSRVKALDICGRVSLSETEVLRLLEGLLVAEALRAHRVQDEVGRAVHDAHDRRDAVAGEGLAQAVNDRNSTRNSGLVVEVSAIGCGGLVELGTMGSQESLIARDDRDALIECTQHEGTGRLDTADQLDDEVHVVDRL